MSYDLHILLDLIGISFSSSDFLFIPSEEEKNYLLQRDVGALR